MSYFVEFQNPRVVKRLNELPESIIAKAKALLAALRLSGPVQKGWKSYSPLKRNRTVHHCHLSSGKPCYVVVWQLVGDNLIRILYVGTHENANYDRFG